MFILKRLFQKLIQLLPLKSSGSQDQGKNFYLIQLKSYPIVHSLPGSVVKAQVIFLNKWLDCPDEKKREHDMIQIMINEEKAKFEYEIREYNAFQRAISKQKSHHLWRQRMRVITRDGVRVDLDLPEEDDSI